MKTAKVVSKLMSHSVVSKSTTFSLCCHCISSSPCIYISNSTIIKALQDQSSSISTTTESLSGSFVSTEGIQHLPPISNVIEVSCFNTVNFHSYWNQAIYVTLICLCCHLIHIEFNIICNFSKFFSVVKLDTEGDNSGVVINTLLSQLITVSHTRQCSNTVRNFHTFTINKSRFIFFLPNMASLKCRTRFKDKVSFWCVYISKHFSSSETEDCLTSIIIHIINRLSTILTSRKILLNDILLLHVITSRHTQNIIIKSTEVYFSYSTTEDISRFTWPYVTGISILFQSYK